MDDFSELRTLYKLFTASLSDAEREKFHATAKRVAAQQREDFARLTLASTVTAAPVELAENNVDDGAAAGEP
jgi:hypothetical protein